MNICQAFEVAKKQVEVKFNMGESNKFMILIPVNKNRPSIGSMGRISSLLMDMDPEDLLMDIDKEDEHKCKIFGPLKEGKTELLDKIPLFKDIPSKVEEYIGRQREIFEVVQSICQFRLVNIVGLPGVGKSSLAKNAAHFIADR